MRMKVNVLNWTHCNRIRESVLEENILQKFPATNKSLEQFVLMVLMTKPLHSIPEEAGQMAGLVVEGS